VDSTSSSSDAGDLRLGKRAVDRGLITMDQLRDALVQHARMAPSAEASASRFGSLLRERGYITSSQLESLLEEDRIATSSSLEPPPAGKGSNLGTFGKFSLRSEVGRGGMGLVYEARDSDLDRRVALKVLLSSPHAEPQERELEEERFIREARLAAKLKHPHIVGVYEAGVIHGRRYIAMEFINGQPLSQWRKKGSITVRQQVSILRDIALAVHHAHEQGIIHRDLKPGNVLIDGRNEPHVADFGLAKFLGNDVSQSFTAEGRVVGTPTYMSPEQVRGAKTIDRRTDVYSMGVMLYEIITGRLPFEGQTAMEVMMKAANDPVEAPHKITSVQLNPTVFRALESICLKAMSRHPDDRYPDARRLATDLTRWLEGQTVRAAGRWMRRQLRQAAVVAGLVLAVAGLAYFGFRPRRSELVPPALPAAATTTSGTPSVRPPALPVFYEAGGPAPDSGLRLCRGASEDCRVEKVEGRTALRPAPSDGRAVFLRFDVDDRWAAMLTTAELEIQYFDAGPAWSNFAVEYDSMDRRCPQDGTYKRAGLVVLEGSRRWRSARFIFTCPRLENRMEQGADIRLGSDRAEMIIHRMELRPWTPPVAFAGPPSGPGAEPLRPGLLGEYHAGTRLADPRKRKVDADLDFDWRGPAWEGGPADQFSIRWSGGVRMPAKGRYLLDVQSDDGVRVFIGGRLTISNWTAHAPMTDAAVCDLEAGFYPLQIEYFEQGGGACLRVVWFREHNGRMWPVDPPPYAHLASLESPK
jgi:tRNA A-37 threonylcarbamoyl transferase component Bud32